MRALALLAIVVSSASCDSSAAAHQAERDALVQRLDAMEQRLDTLEDATAQAQATAAPVAPPTVANPVALPTTVALPRADPSASELAARPSLTLHIDRSGLQIDGVPMSETAADTRFGKAAAADPLTNLVVVADRETPHARVVEVLDRAKRAGLTNIAISVRIPPR